jgi:hypothetical protein
MDVTVLRIEADFHICEGIRILLKRVNYHVQEAENWRKSFSLLNEDIRRII